MKNLFITLIILLVTAIGGLAQTAPPDDPTTPVNTVEVGGVLDEGKGATNNSHHIFPAGQCTQYAANTYRNRTGKNVTWGGDGRMWLINASKAGFPTSKSVNAIVVNAILVFGATGSGIRSYGHVAIVDWISADKKTIRISESNYAKALKVTTRTISVSDLSKLKFLGVILP